MTEKEEVRKGTSFPDLFAVQLPLGFPILTLTGHLFASAAFRVQKFCDHVGAADGRSDCLRTQSGAVRRSPVIENFWPS